MGPQDRIAWIVDRFRSHRAAEFFYVSKTPGGDKRVPICLIPEFLFRDAADAGGLLIVAVGAGSVNWSGQKPMDPFLLIKNRLGPMKLAMDLSFLLNEVANVMKAERARLLPANEVRS